MVGPLILAGARRGEVQCQKLFEEQWTQSLFEARDEPDDFQQRGDKFVWVGEELSEFGGDACFFVDSSSSSTCSLLGKWKKKVPCATPAAATIAFTSAPAIPECLNSVIAAPSTRSRVCRRRASRAVDLTCGVMVCHL